MCAQNTVSLEIGFMFGSQKKPTREMIPAGKPPGGEVPCHEAMAVVGVQMPAGKKDGGPKYIRGELDWNSGTNLWNFSNEVEGGNDVVES